MDKVKLIEFVMTKLFEPEERRIDRRVTELDAQNREIKGGASQGFLLAGQVFVPAAAGKARVGSFPSLDFKLARQGNDLLKDIAAVQADKQAIKQICSVMLQACGDTVQEVRDALPESLVEFIPDFKEVPRLNQEGYTIRDNARAKRQFHKLQDKIDLYVATGMIY